MRKKNSPHYIVNSTATEVCGPFSSYRDAELAVSINTDEGWRRGRILDKGELASYLKYASDMRRLYP